MAKERFSVDSEWEWQEGCRCGSCYEPTGRWKVMDLYDIIPDEFFPSQDEANKHCEELNKTTSELTLCWKEKENV